MSSRRFYQLLNPTVQELRKSGVAVFVKGEEKTNNQIKSKNEDEKKKTEKKKKKEERQKARSEKE